MSSVPQTYLPPELVHAVLIRMEDRDGDYQIIKRGLASCSLICHYWAASIRPLLFRQLTLRSGEDVSLLVAFLDADSFQPALSGCVEYFNVTEDRASAGPPWSHHLMKLRNRLPRAGFLNWKVKGVPAAPADQYPLKRPSPSSLPFSALPRTLPPSISHRVSTLTLSGLSLRSLRDLASLVGNQILCGELILDNVTFREETPDEIQLRRVPASRSILYSIRISHDLPDRDAILYWMKTSHTLFASQGHEQLDGSTLAFVENYLHLLVAHSGRQGQIQRLNLNMMPDISPEPVSKYFHILSERL